MLWNYLQLNVGTSMGCQETKKGKTSSKLAVTSDEEALNKLPPKVVVTLMALQPIDEVPDVNLHSHGNGFQLSEQLRLSSDLMTRTGPLKIVWPVLRSSSLSQGLADLLNPPNFGSVT
jgi:hypothetical protein